MSSGCCYQSENEMFSTNAISNLRNIESQSQQTNMVFYTEILLSL